MDQPSDAELHEPHQPKTVIMVNPESVNLADTKALAAEHDATVIASPYVPLGKMFLFPSQWFTLDG